MAKPVTMPQLGESVTEGTITRWLKAEGEVVEIDEPLAEVDTDKVNAELPSPVAGKIESLLVPEGTTVDVGTEIVLVADDDAPRKERVALADEFPTAETVARPAAEELDPVALAPRSEGNGRGEVKDAETLRRTRSSPVVRRLAAEHDVKIADIPGSGTGGRVTRKDIEGYIERSGAGTRLGDRRANAPANRRRGTRGRLRGRWHPGPHEHPAGHSEPHGHQQA